MSAPAALLAGGCREVVVVLGARGFLRAHPGLVDVVECGDLDAGRDADRPADLGLLDP